MIKHLLFYSIIAAPLASLAEVDLTGVYDIGTLTPLERPAAYGNNLYLTEAEAQKLAAQAEAYNQRANQDSDPERRAPKSGGRVGGYNYFWLDRGSSATTVEGKFRTSIISKPLNGRIPAMTKEGAERMKGLNDQWRLLWRTQDLASHYNTGKAWWLDNQNGIGPYDDIEQRPLAERCIIGSRSTAGPPMLPNLYNNHKRVIQTDDAIMILTEMNHDARIIKLNGSPIGASGTSWLGDSLGVWDGDTLVVTTNNFGITPALSGSDENLVVVERFSLQGDGNLLYSFEISNPTVWSESWGGEFTWSNAGSDKVYEFACHEGNYALGNIMRGARELEREANLAASAGGL